MLQFLRAHPALIAMAVLLVMGTLVCGILGLMMARAGASLRPVYWFAGFFGLIIVPQLAGHLWMAVRDNRRTTPQVEALAGVAAADPAARAGDARALFGPDADPQLITDVSTMFAGLASPAESARFAVLPNGDSVLLAKFAGRAETEKAWVHFLAISGLNQLPGKGDSHRGYAVTRLVGDRAYALPMTTLLGVWTGADDAAIQRRMAAGGFAVPSGAPLDGVEDAPSAASSPSEVVSRKTPVVPWLLTPLIAGYVLLVILYFFKGAAWAGTSTPRPGTAAIAATDLAARLEGINTHDVPFQIERGGRPDELIATWRYADAKWVDLARARGMRRTFRIRMTLDEASGTVRATDYTAGYDWSVGRGGADIEWKSALGIVFFHYEHQRVFGLQIDEHGRPGSPLSYAYTFNLAEMKSPLVDVVTKSGWTWRPTVWQGPAWLRWLTE